MQLFRLNPWRILTLAGLLLMLFTFSAPIASASTRVSDSSNSASGCVAKINSSKGSNVMKAYISITCVGGTAYWITNYTYSEYCNAGAFGVCVGGWSKTNTLPECSAHRIASLRCPSSNTYQRGTASNQLWRWRVETCVQFDEAGTSECNEETQQVQF